MDFLILISIAMMFIFVISGMRYIGGVGWIIFGIEWITKLPHYLQINDYYNSVIVFLAFIFFILIGYAILTDRGEYRGTFIEVTAFSALASLIYFPFAIFSELGDWLILKTADATITLANFLGYEILKYSDKIIELNSQYIEIILACTGIESMALFAGATLGIKADIRRKVTAFLVSVPVIYILNLFRNVFVTVSYGYSWFGENSFYISHHVISKLLATLALIMISLAVFRILPELSDLIFSLKDALAEKYGRFIKR